MTHIRKKTQNFREFCGKVQRALRTRAWITSLKNTFHHIFDDKNWIFSKKQKQSIMRTKINRKFMDMALLTPKKKTKKSQLQNHKISETKKSHKKSPKHNNPPQPKHNTYRPNNTKNIKILPILYKTHKICDQNIGTACHYSQPNILREYDTKDKQGLGQAEQGCVQGAVVEGLGGYLGVVWGWGWEDVWQDQC